MENSEAAFRIKPARDISVRVRRINELGAQSSNVAFKDRPADEQIAILGQQVDELASAVAALTDYIADRDGITFD